MAEAYSRFVARRRWVVLGLLGLFLGTLVAIGVPGFGREGLSLRDLAPLDSPEVQAELTAAEQFAIPLNGRTQVVRRAPDGLSLGVQRSDVRAAYLNSQVAQKAVEQGLDPGPIGIYLPYANTAAKFPASNERSTTTIINLIAYPDSTLTSSERRADELADTERQTEVGRVSVTGGVPAQLETGRIIRANLDRLQLLSIIALILVVALWQRSLVVPGIVIATVGAEIVMLLHALAFAADHDWFAVPAEVLPVIVAVAIGIATDYVLFYIGAFRRAVVDHDPGEAARRAIVETVPLVLAAGSTTALGAASLLLADTGFIRAFAPGLVTACVTAMLAAVALTPALLVVAARALFWPSKAPTAARSNRYAGWLTASKRRRLIVGGGIAAVVLGLATQVSASPIGFNVVTGLPDDNEVSIGAHDAAKGFAPGILSPTLLLLQGHDLKQQSVALASFADRVQDHDGVAGVFGANTFQNTLSDVGLGEEFPQEAEATSQGLLVSDDGRYARLIVVLDREAYTGAAAETIDRLKSDFPDMLAESGLDADTQVTAAGDSALVSRVNQQLSHDLLFVGGGLLVIELLILLLVLRRPRLAIVVIGSSLAVVAAALGSVSIADRVFGNGDGVAFFVPIAVMVLLVSIGVDYGILMSRAWLDCGGRPPVDRARSAISEASPTIMQAGLVLFLTFAMLAVVPLGAFTQFAVAMGVGVALDTFFVRPVLMPLLLAATTSTSARPNIYPRSRRSPA